ncbi:hypothetical protein PP411_gp47 [Vibrio phage vB_VpP_BT-1011]|uniref:Uncharacterized protein n=1 Tax=Vibrio phage vB_VpP_BT-1011 TaxID=2799672 RepID=A0A8F2XX36_9CAUD|nr:hypothetical protein PP411_gp47 [Vibrio phage vB_VpP_BT-1011]QWX10246.1 hypothetical protein vBVpPBT1011_0047 [Vibrio phage vB_VpP_BT-1011]
MKAYKTYQEAKINNPDSVIVVFIKPGSEHHGRFEVQIIDGIGSQLMHPSGHWHICKPADYLPSLEWFFGEGYKLVNGDIFINKKGEPVEIGKDYHGIIIYPQFANERIPSTDSECYVLRADALTKMKFVTESPEEKEALDMIDTTSKQVDSLAKGDVVEWKNGDECQHKNGVIYTFIGKCDNPKEFDCILMDSSGNAVLSFVNELSKPESPEQKAECERLEAIKEMAQTPKPCGFAIYDICEQLYDAGYRKESK